MERLHANLVHQLISNLNNAQTKWETLVAAYAAHFYLVRNRYPNPKRWKGTMLNKIEEIEGSILSPEEIQIEKEYVTGLFKYAISPFADFLTL